MDSWSMQVVLQHQSVAILLPLMRHVKEFKDKFSPELCSRTQLVPRSKHTLTQL